MTNTLKTNSFLLNKEIVENQLDLLWSFTRSLAYYRAIRQDYSQISSNKNYWGNTMDICYLKAVNDWCIVFGGDNNESHWKKLPQNSHKGFKHEIRTLIYKATGFTESEWKKYHKETVGFRNCYAAHRNVGFSANVPNLDKALEVAHVYFEKIKELLRPSTNEPKSLLSAFPEFQIDILLVLQRDMKLK